MGGFCTSLFARSRDGLHFVGGKVLNINGRNSKQRDEYPGAFGAS